MKKLNKWRHRFDVIFKYVDKTVQGIIKNWSKEKKKFRIKKAQNIELWKPFLIANLIKF